MINIIAIGSPFNNDTISLQLIEDIENNIRQLDGEIRISYCYSPATELIHSLNKDSYIILVDAFISETAGEIALVDPQQLILDEAHFSSHQLSVANVLQLAKNLDHLPKRLYILGIGITDQPLTTDQYQLTKQSLFIELSKIAQLSQC